MCIRDRAQDAYGKAAGHVESAYGRVADQAQRLPREQPMALVLSSLSLGLLFGYLLARR